MSNILRRIQQAMEAILIAPEKFDSLQELKRLGLVLSNNESAVYWYILVSLLSQNRKR